MKGSLDLSEIIQVDFPSSQYYREEHNKKQIVLHHTVSGESALSDARWWKMTRERIATSIIIARDGKLYQCFSTKYWAHHLGIERQVFENRGFDRPWARNKTLNQQSIAIELDSWGGLIKEEGNWKNKNGEVMHPDKLCLYPKGYRGYYAYEKYTASQLEVLRTLLIYLCDRYQIPDGYNEEMWEVSDNALMGSEGIWTHNSYRSDKADCHPQKELKQLLININA